MPLVIDDDLEAARLAAVRRYEVLDTPPDGAFDRVTRIASAIFDVPISIVSIVDHDRIWFKSSVGVPGVEQLDRVPGLCASAIMQDELWLVEDAALDPRTLANPLVAGEFGLRFYAGSPLRTRDGFRLGTLCVLDREPRSFNEEQQSLLEDLGAIVMDELELRLAARRHVAELEARHRHATELNDDVVQALATAQLALQLQQTDQAREQLAGALEASKRILGDLSDGSGLRRDHPAD